MKGSTATTEGWRLRKSSVLANSPEKCSKPGVSWEATKTWLPFWLSVWAAQDATAREGAEQHENESPVTGRTMGMNHARMPPCSSSRTAVGAAARSPDPARPVRFMT